MTYEDFVTKYEVEMTATLVEFNAKDDTAKGHDGKPWHHDAWSLEIKQKHGRVTERFSFRTGTGNRVNAGPAMHHELESLGDVVRARGRSFYIDKGSRWEAKAPKLADVLQCLASDAGALEETFEDWCSNYGYDSDSRKAEKTYRACVETAQQLVRLFGFDGLRELRECTETAED